MSAMERLTQNGFDYCAEYCTRSADCGFFKHEVPTPCGDAAIYNRLAAYEDTGLEPGELVKTADKFKWISVDERLPAYGESVIVARRAPDGKWRIEQGRRDCGGWWKVYGSLVKRVEYWMPMPAEPEVGT